MYDMRYEFRGRTLDQAIKKTVSDLTCKNSNRKECERISRIRANHANNVLAILEEIGETIREINDRVDHLGNDARAALLSTVGDVASIVFAGAGAIRAVREGVVAIDDIIAGGSTFAALFSVENILSDYQNRLSAFREWREISSLRAAISRQRMDLNRSIRILKETSAEGTRLGCGSHDPNDLRNY
jgi:hypothetical protein